LPNRSGKQIESPNRIANLPPNLCAKILAQLF
jgi:hypothetical protein